MLNILLFVDYKDTIAKLYLTILPYNTQVMLVFILSHVQVIYKRHTATQCQVTDSNFFKNTTSCGADHVSKHIKLGALFCNK